MRYSSSRQPDYVIIFCFAALIIFGLVMLVSASSNLAQIRFGDPNYYFNHQLIFGLIPGLIGFLAGYFIYYRYWQKAAILFGLLSVVLLFLVFTPLGFNAGGAERWVQLGPVTFQPAEVVKLTFILYLAAWLGGSIDRAKSFRKGFMPFLAVSGLVAILLLKQPATSTVAILMGSAAVIYFISGAKWSYIIGFFLLAATIFTLVIYFTPYRLNRILNYINPAASPEGGGYHLSQALIAIGSGGWFGVGFGQSTTKINFLPEPIGDSIFAVIAEELGFIGSSTLILIFLVLIIRIFRLAKKAPDRFAKLALIGFGTLIAAQSFVNIAAISGIIPLTGMPLPFISYGGTALAVFMTMMGVVLNISRNH